MGAIGKSRKRSSKPWHRLPWFEFRKQYFLIKSPYLNYVKSKHEKYASVTSKGSFPKLVTPITKTKHRADLLRKLKKPLDHVPTHEKLINRTLEVFAPDIIPSISEELNYNIVNLKICDVPTPLHAETEFNGFRLTKDKLASLTRKWHSTITLNQEFKSLDGCKVRIFMTASTRMRELQIKKTCYANKSQIQRIRTVMTQVIQNHISKMTILEFVERMAIKCEFSKEIRAKCENIYPLEEQIHITKSKKFKTNPFFLKL